MRLHIRYWFCVTVTFLAFVVLWAGCSVKLVADYDSATAEAILETAKTVDGFYIRLLDVPEEERSYAQFADAYNSIEVEIRSLLMRNEIRPLNSESKQITETTLNFWIKYKDAHKENDTYKDVLVNNHRRRFSRLFVAMAVAEEAKKAATEDDNE